MTKRTSLNRSAILSLADGVTYNTTKTITIKYPFAFRDVDLKKTKLQLKKSHFFEISERSMSSSDAPQF